MGISCLLTYLISKWKLLLDFVLVNTFSIKQSSPSHSNSWLWIIFSRLEIFNLCDSCSGRSKIPLSHHYLPEGKVNLPEEPRLEDSGTQKQGLGCPLSLVPSIVTNWQG
jgi:hypothetical protein